LVEECVSLSSLRGASLVHSNKAQVYIFVGTIILGAPWWWRGLLGIIAVVVGLAYCVLEFIPSIEPPANMREADGGWGAEQV